MENPYHIKGNLDVSFAAMIWRCGELGNCRAISCARSETDVDFDHLVAVMRRLALEAGDRIMTV
ncbi:MAG: hypothetical protein MUC82_15530, partial [Cypionkella sp.]|nr:hypothetical protein [Cypionkella sp.]